MPGFGNQYDTVDDAAAAALMWLERQPRSKQMEYATYIYQDPSTSKFYRGGFQRGDSGHVDMQPADDIPGNLVALVHNHPVRNDEVPTSALSEQDYKTGVDLHNILMYLAGMNRSTPSTDVKMNPKDARRIRVFTRVPNSKQRAAVVAYEGKPFLAEYPIDEHLKYIQTRLMGRKPNDPRGAYMPDDLHDALADEMDDSDLRALNLSAVLSSLK